MHSAPTIGTAIVPLGTQLSYSQYQSAVNSRIFGDAIEKESAAAQSTGGQPNVAYAKYSMPGALGAMWAVGFGALLGAGMMGTRL